MLAIAAVGSKSSLFNRRSKSERRPALSMHQSSDYWEERERETEIEKELESDS